LSIYLDWAEKNKIEKKRRIVFLFSIILFVPFLSTYSGIRNNTALALFTYGAYQLIINKKRVSWVFLILANLTHFMTLTLTLLLIPTYFLKIKQRTLKYLFIFSFMFLVIPSNPIINWLAAFDSGFAALEQSQYSYLGSSEWSNFYLTGLSFKGKIFLVLTLLPYFLTLLYLITTNGNSSIRKYAYMLAILTNIFSSVPGTLYKRYCQSLIFIALLLVLYEYKDYLWFKAKSYYIYIYICLFIILRLSGLYTMRYSIKKSYSEIIVYNITSYFNKQIDENEYIRNR
jgi:hypothetical protein